MPRSPRDEGASVNAEMAEAARGGSPPRSPHCHVQPCATHVAWLVLVEQASAVPEHAATAVQPAMQSAWLRPAQAVGVPLQVPFKGVPVHVQPKSWHWTVPVNVVHASGVPVQLEPPASTMLQPLVIAHCTLPSAPHVLGVPVQPAT